jgi:transcriptional regulator with XRE-family HTH domain
MVAIIMETLSGDPMKKNRETAKAVKTFRASLGLSQSALAKKLKVARSTVAKWESGENMVPGKVILDIQKWERKYLSEKKNSHKEKNVNA